MLPEFKMPPGLEIEGEKLYLDFMVKTYISGKANSSFKESKDEFWFLQELYNLIVKLWPNVGSWQHGAILKQIISMGQEDYKSQQNRD